MTHPSGRLLDRRARLQIEVDLDARQTRAELVERDHSAVCRTIGNAPLDPLVRTLLLDLGLELLRDAPDLGLERDVGLILLRDLLQPFGTVEITDNICGYVWAKLGYANVLFGSALTDEMMRFCRNSTRIGSMLTPSRSRSSRSLTA